MREEIHITEQQRTVLRRAVLSEIAELENEFLDRDMDQYKSELEGLVDGLVSSSESMENWDYERKEPIVRETSDEDLEKFRDGLRELFEEADTIPLNYLRKRILDDIETGKPAIWLNPDFYDEKKFANVLDRACTTARREARYEDADNINKLIDELELRRWLQ